MAQRNQDVVLGVDLGGTSFLVAAVDGRGKLLAQASKKTKAERGFEAVVARVAKVARELVEEKRISPKALCVGVPGALDPSHGVVVKAPNLRWENAPLAKALEKELKLPVSIDNDVNVAVIGEHQFGAARGLQNVVGLWIGTGIGGGVLVGGQLYRGSHGTAGELGHTVLLADGPLCPCGGRGCVEALASRTSIERDVRAALKRGRKSILQKSLSEEGSKLTSSAIEEALDAEDSLMLEALERACHYIGLFAASVANAFDPEMIVIGGGLASRLGDRFLEPIRRAAQSQLLPRRGHVRIVATELGDRAGAMGAAALASAMPRRRERVSER